MGAGAPIATGAAFASKYNNEGRVAVCFSGDGATSQGAWHEALNLAAALELPVIFVIENNHYAVTLPYAEQTKAARLSDRALGYGMPGVTIDGMDVLAVHAAASEAVDRARAGGGPTLIECDTYRFNTHTGRSEAALDSRPAHEIAAYRERDPIEALQRVLEDRSLITAEGAERIILEVRDEIDEALTRSQTRPLPDPADLVADVYTPTTSLRLATDGPQPDGSERQISFREAISEALSGEMERDPGIFIVGTGDVFGLTRGIKETLGEGRIVNTPVSESAITGLGIGSAARGLRPLVSLMFMDFMAICFDQILNQMAKMKYMFGGKATLPLTVFVNAGAGTSMGSQHSQSLEALLCHIPGLKVVMPSTPADAKGLFTSAIRDDNPVFRDLPQPLRGDQRARPRGALRDPARLREHRAPRRRPHHRGHGLHGPRGAAGGRPPRRARHQRRDRRSAQPPAAGHRHDRAVRAEDAPGADRSRGGGVRRHRWGNQRADRGAGVRLPRRSGRCASQPRSARCPTARCSSRRGSSTRTRSSTPRSNSSGHSRRRGEAARLAADGGAAAARSRAP